MARHGFCARLRALRQNDAQSLAEPRREVGICKKPRRADVTNEPDVTLFSRKDHARRNHQCSPARPLSLHPSPSPEPGVRTRCRHSHPPCRYCAIQRPCLDVSLLNDFGDYHRKEDGRYYTFAVRLFVIRNDVTSVTCGRERAPAGALTLASNIRPRPHP